MFRKEFLGALALVLGASASAQLRVATYNISNYGGGRSAALQTAIFGEFQGRSMRPDVILGQEFLSQAAVNEFLTILNTAPGSTGNWAAGPFTNGPDTDSAFFYRTDKVEFVQAVKFSSGAAAPNPPRDGWRYDIRLRGFTALQPKIALYNVHLKAGNTTTDEARRLVEANRVRTNAATLDSTYWGFLIGGDFNVYSSSEDPYQAFLAAGVGRFNDPASRPGAWDGDTSYRFLHTQDPSGSGGMDSRFDFILLSDSLYDGVGMDYVGPLNNSYGVSTWNEGGHSYRAWGNDGGSFNATLRTTGNTMVGPTIAQALRDAATTAGGHLPVFLDLYAPAQLGANVTTLNFGKVIQGSVRTLPVSLLHQTPVSLWGSGIANLPWQAAAGSFGVSSATGTLFPGGAQTLQVTAPTQNPGIQSGTLNVTSSDPHVNPLAVPLTVQVVPNNFLATSAALRFGTNGAGNVTSLQASDNQYLEASLTLAIPRGESPISFGLTANAQIDTVASLNVEIESRGSLSNMPFTLLLKNVSTGLWEAVATDLTVNTDTVRTYAIPNPNRYLTPTGDIEARLNWRNALTGGRSQRIFVDQVRFLISG